MKINELKVILADDHAILRTGLRLLLEAEGIQIVGEAGSGREVLTLVDTIPADILILDLSMPDIGGIEVLKQIKEKGYPIHVLVLTMHNEEQYVKAAMMNGASGYVEKSAFDKELLNAIKTVMSGQIYLSNKHALLMVNSLLHTEEAPIEADPHDLLSKREIEVLRLLVRGYSLAEAGEKLSLSLKTVDTYKTRIFDKLGISRKSEMVQYALNHGLLGGDDN